MYTATKTGKGFANGQVWVVVLYTDGVTKFETVYRENTISPDWPDASMRARLAQLNGMDLSVIPLGAAQAQPVDPVPVLTPAQIARNAWLVAFRAWKRKKAEFESGLSTTATQAGVNAAQATAKATYLPEYGDFL